MSSYITLFEVLVRPLRVGNQELAGKYKEMLTQSRNVILCRVTRAIAEKGAEIRAKHNYRTPDAIHLASALQQGAQAFITNDRDLKGFSELEVVILRELLHPT